MGSATFPIADALVSEAIRKIVARAIEDGSVLSCSEAAAAVGQGYPNSGQNLSEIEDQIIMAAASAGVPVEIGRRVVGAVSIIRARSKTKGAAGVTNGGAK